MDVLKDVFNECDQMCIMTIPFHESNNDDVLYWSKEIIGEYSVRSAYNLLQVKKGSWIVEDNAIIWKQVWRIKAPPKTLNLLWRALSGCLQTMVQLQQKHVEVQKMCPVGLKGDKSIIHSLVLCLFASQWRILIPDMYVNESNDFTSWLCQILNICKQDKYAEIATMCWAIWKAHNDLVWNQKWSCVNSVVASAKQYLVQWKSAQVCSTSAHLHSMIDRDGAMHWVKPHEDTLKVTFDATLFRDRNEFGLSMVARDLTGALVQARTNLYRGDVTPELAEAMVVKEALS